MTWTITRGALYAICLALLTGTAIGLTALGYGQYDEATNTFTPGPVNLTLLAGVIAAAVAGPLTALVAVVRGWGHK